MMNRFTPRHLTMQWLLISTLALSLTSCLGPKKIDKWVSKQYGGELPQATKKKVEYVTVTSSLNSMGNELSQTKKKTSHFLPLIFYWQFDYDNTCTLNPQIPVNNFTTTVLTQANKRLKEKLKGQRLEISLDKLPNVFAVKDREHMIWLVYAYAWSKISVQPERTDMVVSYKVIGENNSVTKTGTITVANNDKGIALGIFQSLKKKTWEYLDQYNANITVMSKAVVDQLADQL